MPHDPGTPEPAPPLAPQPWCKKHRRKYRTYFSGERDCPLCVEERIADLHRQRANLREDI